jgi:hypothetical protein
MPDAKPLTLTEYMASQDPNLFWRLSAGEHQNLLDEAIERIEKLEAEADRDQRGVVNIQHQHKIIATAEVDISQCLKPTRGKPDE